MRSSGGYTTSEMYLYLNQLYPGCFSARNSQGRIYGGSRAVGLKLYSVCILTIFDNSRRRTCCFWISLYLMRRRAGDTTDMHLEETKPLKLQIYQEVVRGLSVLQ
jgi:hypothetical protein